jgi:hypothetical protein
VKQILLRSLLQALIITPVLLALDWLGLLPSL